VGTRLVTTTMNQRVALVTLSNPTRRNAISVPMRDELVFAFDQLERDIEVGAVVITGAGSAFCAGADLGALADAGAHEFGRIYDAFVRVARSPLPTVAAVNGPAVGAGLNLALACDIRIAGRSARFVARFLELGLHPGGGNTWMLQRAVGDQLARAMIVFREELDGESAARGGLALRCVDDDLLLTEAQILAAHAAAAPRELVRRIKDTFRLVAEIDDFDEAVALELEAQVWSSQQNFFRERLLSRLAGGGDHAS